MKLKLDENLPVDLVVPLARLGHDADTVVQERLLGQDDARVWKAAQEEGRFLVSQDLGFSDIRSHAPGTQFKTDEEAFAGSEAAFGGSNKRREKNSGDNLPLFLEGNAVD